MRTLSSRERYKYAFQPRSYFKPGIPWRQIGRSVRYSYPDGVIIGMTEWRPDYEARPRHGRGALRRQAKHVRA